MDKLKHRPTIEQLKDLFNMNYSNADYLFPEMTETDSVIPKPVNVASVPHRSPFRYPGGKTWFVPNFRKWISSLWRKPAVLVEPFAGGGIISLTALFEDLVGKAIMVELDEEVASVWQAIKAGHARWLAKRILEFNLTKESLIQEISERPKDIKHKAFQTILKNRTFHGGILAEGSGLIKYGENGKGLSSRWYPSTLAKRILNLELIAQRIEFHQTDGLKILKQYEKNNEMIFFIDPPYTAGGKKAGKRLYRHYELDHDTLFRICEKLKGDFVITYDHSEEVKEMARSHGFQMRLISMTNTHNNEMNELVIGRSLSWMDSFPSVQEPIPSYGMNVRKHKKARKSER